MYPISIQKLYLKLLTQSVNNLSSMWSLKHVNNTTFVHTYIQNIGQTQANTTYTFIQMHTI